MKRGRNQRRRPGNNPNRALDSNGPEVRIRGTANQIYDKYIALARDASSAGDRIKAESYLQHAEHYFRVIRATQPPQQAQQTQRDGAGDGEQPSIENGQERNDDRNDEAPARNNSRRRRGGEEQANAAETQAAETETAKDESTADAEEAAEEKPKRRRAKRTTKRVAKADKEDAGADPQAAAAE